MRGKKMMKPSYRNSRFVDRCAQTDGSRALAQQRNPHKTGDVRFRRRKQRNSEPLRSQRSNGVELGDLEGDIRDKTCVSAPRVDHSPKVVASRVRDEDLILQLAQRHRGSPRQAVGFRYITVDRLVAENRRRNLVGRRDDDRKIKLAAAQLFYKFFSVPLHDVKADFGITRVKRSQHSGNAERRKRKWEPETDQPFFRISISGQRADRLIQGAKQSARTDMELTPLWRELYPPAHPLDQWNAKHAFDRSQSSRQ